MFLSCVSGCSFFYENKYHRTKKLNNRLNREIISNYSKALTKKPDTFLFYFERGIAKHDYGDYFGAIKDFNNSLRLNPNPKVIFSRANSKYAYGDYEGAIKDFEKLISEGIFPDQVFYNMDVSALVYNVSLHQFQDCVIA